MNPDLLTLANAVIADEQTVATKQQAVDAANADLVAAKTAAMANAVALQEASNTIVANLMPSTAVAPLPDSPPAA